MPATVLKDETILKALIFAINTYAFITISFRARQEILSLSWVYSAPVELVILLYLSSRFTIYVFIQDGTYQPGQLDKHGT